MIVVVDYGMGNLHSIQSKIESLKYDVMISSRVNDIDTATKLILPGVGSFAKGMENIREYGVLDILNKKVLRDNTPILGICLGMELLTNFSEEGNAEPECRSGQEIEREHVSGAAQCDCCRY